MSYVTQTINKVVALPKLSAMKAALLFVSSILITYAVTGQQNEISPKADSLYHKIMAAARPAVKNWVTSTVTKYKGKDLTQDQALAEANQSYAVLGNMNGADIEALAFLVLMQASKSAQEDLKSIINEVKSINNAKAAQRQQLNTLKNSSATMKTTARADYKKPDSLNPSKTAIALKAADLKDKKDNMSDMSSEQQLKMQMVMDRRSKMNEAISNLLKKVSETEQQIIQNLK
jgi:hypothetical protein